LEAELHRRYSQAFEQYANLTKAFMSQWQGSAGAATAAPPPVMGMPDITKTLSDWFQKSIVGSGADLSQAWTRFAGTAPLGAMPGTLAGAAAGASPLEQLLKQQEAIARRLFELAAQCQRLQSRLAAHWASVGQSAAQNFLGAMQTGAPAAADPAQWPQKIYAAWIDNAEKAYAQAARGAEYLQLLGALTNAANAFKAEQNALMELWAKYFDHPTRSELDALNQQVRELSEQFRQWRRAPGT
jgi:hypothetical protein